MFLHDEGIFLFVCLNYQVKVQCESSLISITLLRLYVANKVQQFSSGSKNGIHFLFKEMDYE